MAGPFTASALGRWFFAGLGLLSALGVGCTSEFDRNSLAERPCPCLTGWSCDTSRGESGVCVRAELGFGGNLGTTSTPFDASTPAEDAASATHTGGSGNGNGGTEALDDAGNPPPGAACAAAPTPTGVGCPSTCTDCSDGVCHIRCDAKGACSGTTATPLVIDCPAGFQCEVTCSADDTCKVVSVNCPSDQACNMLCTGKKACQDFSLQCAGGPCSLHCGSQAQVCRNSELSCGTGACQASCEGSTSPSVLGCDTSCSEVCGC